MTSGPSRPSLRLVVQYATACREAPTRPRFRRWVASALEQDAQIVIRIVDEEEGRRLNREFRRKDYATNVLTFVYDQGQVLAGDIVLCAPVVLRQAREQGKDAGAHYAHLTVHGVLHLQGYDHERSRDAAAMERLETRILARLGFPDPYRVEAQP